MNILILEVIMPESITLLGEFVGVPSQVFQKYPHPEREELPDVRVVVLGLRRHARSAGGEDHRHQDEHRRAAQRQLRVPAHSL